MNPEIFRANASHGHSLVLKRYARFPRFLPLPVTLQHGWFTQNYTAKWYRSSRLPVYWVWSKRSAALLHAQQAEAVEIVGAPFIYFCESSPRSQKRRPGTIAFPAHSSETFDAVYEFERYADMVCELPREFHPVTVCLYWSDVERGRDRPFKQRGLEVVSCGERYDPYFLRNFIGFADRHTYATSNAIRSATFYCVYMGLRFFRYGPEAKFFNVSDSFVPLGPVEDDTTASLSSLNEVFSMDRVDDIDPQYDAAVEELGLLFKLSRDQMLRSLIEKMDVNYLSHATAAAMRRVRRGLRSARKGSLGRLRWGR